MMNHLIERFKIVDDRANRFNSEIAVVVTAHHAQRRFMKTCLTSVHNIGSVTMVYDNPGNDHNSHLPSNECFNLIDTFIIKHRTKEVPGPTYPQFWNFKHALNILNGSKCEYIFVIGADSILENPFGINDIKLLLNDNEIISCSSNPEKIYCNTKSFLVRKNAFKKIIDFVEKTYIPFKDIGNMEYRFGLAIKTENIKEKIAPRQPNDNQFSYSYDSDGNCIDRGTWGNILGYRHLGGEMKIRKQNGIKEIEQHYIGE